MTIEHRDDTGARFGMWLFLYTEVILLCLRFRRKNKRVE